MLKSGFTNPIATFFTNITIIEGPKLLKDQLFKSVYKYFDRLHNENALMLKLKTILIKYHFSKGIFGQEASTFISLNSTALTFILYDIVTVDMSDNDIYLSAYDFIQPDTTLITNPESLDPSIVSTKYMDILKIDLDKFKQIKNNFQEHLSDTIYHKTYKEFVTKNIKVLCDYIYGNEEC